MAEKKGKLGIVTRAIDWMKRPGAFEKNNGAKRNLPIAFGRPPSLEEQMLRVVRSEIFREGVRRRAANVDPELYVEEGPTSPHEMVFDKDLGREMPRWEKEAIDRDRAEFDRQLKLREEHVRRIKEARRYARPPQKNDPVKDKKKPAPKEPVEE